MGRLLRFVLLDIDGDSEPRDRTLPVVLSVPDDIAMPDDANSKNLVLRAVTQKNQSRRWRRNRKFALSEVDAQASPAIRSMFDCQDWASLEPIWIEMPENAEEAHEYVKMVGLSKSVEGLIASNTFTAYRYAFDILEGRFPEGEEEIAKDAVKSVNYANMAKCRIPLGEKLIAKSEELAFQYGKIMKKFGLWSSWTEDEIAVSPVWMYQYAKDHIGGKLPDDLHNKMHLMSFADSENKWVRKYLGAKKYVLKKKGGS